MTTLITVASGAVMVNPILRTYSPLGNYAVSSNHAAPADESDFYDDAWKSENSGEGMDEPLDVPYDMEADYLPRDNKAYP